MTRSQGDDYLHRRARFRGCVPSFTQCDERQKHFYSAFSGDFPEDVQQLGAGEGDAATAAGPSTSGGGAHPLDEDALLHPLRYQSCRFAHYRDNDAFLSSKNVDEADARLFFEDFAETSLDYENDDQAKNDPIGRLFPSAATYTKYPRLPLSEMCYVRGLFKIRAIPELHFSHAFCAQCYRYARPHFSGTYDWLLSHLCLTVGEEPCSIHTLLMVLESQLFPEEDLADIDDSSSSSSSSNDEDEEVDEVSLISGEAADEAPKRQRRSEKENHLKHQS